MRLTNGRRTGAVVAAVALVAVLAACGGGRQPGGAPAGGASAWALTGESGDVLGARFDAWNEANPDEQFTVEYFANDAYKEKIRTAVGAGNAPTLIYSWAGGTLEDYVANGNVVDLGDSTARLEEQLIDSVADNGKVDGVSYAVPTTHSQPVVLYYNQEVLDAAGVEVPTTYEELLDAVGVLRDHDVIPVALAGQSVWPELMWIQYLTDRIGGPEVFQAVLDGEEGAWSDPAIVEATTKIRELVDAGAFGDTFGSVNADQNGDTALLQTGKAGFVLQGSWVYPDFVAGAPELVESGGLGYTAFPLVDGGAGDPANIVGNPSNFWSVSADASPEAQETAKKFIETEVLNDAAVDDLLAIGTVPPITGIEDRIAEQDDADYLSFVYDLVSDAPHFQLSWDQALPPRAVPGAAGQPEPAVPRSDRPAAVLRRHGRDAVTVAAPPTTHRALGHRAQGHRAQGPSAWMATPALALFGLFAVVPLLGVVVLSFMSWDGLGDPVWAGAENWGRTLSDPVTLNAMRLTVVVTIVSWLFQAPVSLLLGVFMAGRQRYRAVLSVLYFLPLLFSAAAVAIAFRALLDPNFGLGPALGVPWLAQDWIGNPDLALWVVLFVIGWCFVPFHSLLYQGGVRQIPASLYEAALLDGAGRVQQFFHITLPQLKYTIITSSTLMIVGSLTYFDLIFVLTGGGPGNATRILPLDMYLTGFRSYDMGRASVIAVILVAVGLGVSLALNRLSGAHRMESQQEGV